MTNCISATNRTAVSVLVAVLTLVIATPLRAQTAVETPHSFEVASIRAVGPDPGLTVFPKFPSAQFSGENMSLTLLISVLAGLLTRPVGRPVIDKTGIAGHYKLDLRFAPPASTDSPYPSIFTALQEQLGLKLETQKVPTDFLVIDHIEKVSTEN